jgi:lactate dehydrogenase-like 2-hydroxyacid dehydrogenase
MKKIVVYKSLPEDVLAYLQQHAQIVEVDPSQHDAFVAALRDADGGIGASVKITPAMLEGASRLKALSTISVGYDQFDVDDLTRRGIVLAHTPDVLTESTADTVFSLILASARRVVELAEWVKAGQWRASIGPAQFGVDVQGKTIGIVGLGRIGGAVARRAALGFNMKVLYTNRSANQHAEQAYRDQRLARRDRRRTGADRGLARRHDSRRGPRRVRHRTAAGRLAVAVDAERGRAAAHRFGHARDPSCDGAQRGAEPGRRARRHPYDQYRQP